MAFKTILVHIDSTQRVSERIGVALDMAKSCNAHLIGMAATGMSGLSYLAVAASTQFPQRRKP